MLTMLVDLKYPTFDHGKLVDTKAPMLSEKEMFVLLDWESEGKGLYWNNHWIDIGKSEQGKPVSSKWFYVRDKTKT